jgi:hypothetical protein
MRRVVTLLAVVAALVIAAPAPASARVGAGCEKSTAALARVVTPGRNGRIAFESWRGPVGGIYTMRPNGSDVRYVGVGRQSASSPDGSLIG